MNCRICQGNLKYIWSLKILHNRFSADYYECNRCHSLQVAHPYWIEESYKDEALPPTTNLDTGRFRRNFSAYSYIMALCKAGVFCHSPRILDYGGGYGLLTQMLLDAGYDAWTSDRHITKPFLAPHRCIKTTEALPQQSFDVIVCLEVFEHLLDPLTIGAKLVGALKSNGTLLISTEIYDPSFHDHTWSYLATESGQHITLWTHESIRFFAQKFGFRSIGYFPDRKGFLIVFSHASEIELNQQLTDGLRVLTDQRHLVEITEPWDFRNKGILSDSISVLLLTEGQSDVKTAYNRMPFFSQVSYSSLWRSLRLRVLGVRDWLSKS